jgi:hypothetical protein
MRTITSSKLTKILIAVIITLTAVIATPYIFNSTAEAQQETCPDGGDWVKVDGINAQSYNYTAPAGKLIVEVCYKAGTTVKYKTIDPGQASVNVTTDVPNPNDNAFQDISHASFRLSTIPTEEPKDGEITLSGECLGDGSIQWTVSSTYDSAVSFSWQTTNNESGNGQVPANDSTSFSTTNAGNDLSLSYTVDNEQKQTNKVVNNCEEPKEGGEITLSGECLGDGSIQWTVTSTYESAVSFSWQTTNNESGNGQVPANNSTTFKTTNGGNDLTLSYTADNEQKQTNKVVNNCEEPKEGDVVFYGECQNDGTILWTIVNTNEFSVPFTWESTNKQSGSGEVSANDSVSFTTSYEGNNVTVLYSIDDQEEELGAATDVCSEPNDPEDPTPDVAAGGFGPSLIATIAPFALGLTGLGAGTALVLNLKKKK